MVIKMELKKIRKAAWLLCILAVLLGAVVPSQLVSAAIKEVKVDEEEYNLVIEDVPSFTSEWSSLFAKMNNNSKPENFNLSLFDDVESTDAMMAGLEKAGKKVDVDNVYGMQIMLYEMDAKDGEYYPVDKSVNVTIICPVPDYWIETPDKVQLYNLSSADKAQTFTSSLVSVNEIPCLMFTVKSTGVYGLVYSGETPDSSQDEEKVVATPTTKPKATPTLAPNASTSNMTTMAPVREEVAETARPKTNTSVKTVNKNKKLDDTPQTGDEAPVSVWLLASVLSGSASAAIILYLKRK